jgi:hypothetical protein
MNVKERTRRYWTEDPSILPEEMAKEYEDFGSATIALNGTPSINSANSSRQANDD